MDWCPAHLSCLSPASPWLWALKPSPPQAVKTMAMMSALSQLQLLLQLAVGAHPFSEPEPHASGGVSQQPPQHRFSFSFSFRFPKASLGTSGETKQNRKESLEGLVTHLQGQGLTPCLLPRRVHSNRAPPPQMACKLTKARIT